MAHFNIIFPFIRTIRSSILLLSFKFSDIKALQTIHEHHLVASKNIYTNIKIFFGAVQCLKQSVIMIFIGPCIIVITEE